MLPTKDERGTRGANVVIQAQREALIGLLLVILPNLVLVGVGLLMRRQAQQVTEAQAAGVFGIERLLRQVGLNAFLLLPMGIWLWRRRTGLAACGWQQVRLGRAAGVGVLLGAAVLFLRAQPFAPERLALSDTWWALATYSVVAVSEETLFRGFLQGRLEAWLGRWWGYFATALLFSAVHLPTRLLGGEPLAQALTYATVQLLPMALLFGGAMSVANHAAAPTLLHLAWNWASVIRR
ncbi:MAG: CPBP family intramembrane metalloprotease [Chloroflexi bacterium]|nr:CPBP family intramembrane metalloprotease [Chloroflexota bacterium]